MIENDVITNRINNHSYAGDPDDPEARLVYSQIRNETTPTEDQSSAIIPRTIESVLHTTLANLPKTRSIARTIRRRSNWSTKKCGQPYWFSDTCRNSYIRSS